MFSSPAPDSSVRRWLSVLVRSIHLLAVTAFGAMLLGAPNVPGHEHVGTIVFASGIFLWVIDLWHRPAHLIEGAGASMLLKLVLLAGMLFSPQWREPLFWIVVAWSAVFSHAPARFRNTRFRRNSNRTSV